jgi:hypothetical protein
MDPSQWWWKPFQTSDAPATPQQYASAPQAYSRPPGGVLAAPGTEAYNNVHGIPMDPTSTPPLSGPNANASPGYQTALNNILKGIWNAPGISPNYSAVQDAYNQALGGIQSSFQNALGAVQSRENQAMGMIPQLNTDIQNQYRQSEAQVGQQAQNLQNMANATAGMPLNIQATGKYTPSAAAGPFSNALAASAASHAADMGYLKLGTGQFFGNMIQQMQENEADRLATLKTNEAKDLATLQADAARNYSGIAGDVYRYALPQLMKQQGLGQQNFLADLSQYGSTPQQIQQYFGKNSGLTDMQTTFYRGGFINQYDPQYVSQVMDSKEYKTVTDWLQKNPINAQNMVTQYAKGAKQFAKNPGAFALAWYQALSALQAQALSQAGSTGNVDIANQLGQGY